MKRRRSGVLARKIGMTQLPVDGGRMSAVTVLKMDGVQVVALRTTDHDGYSAVCLGSGAVKTSRVAKAQRVFFSKQGVGLKRRVTEFRVDGDDSLPKVGDEFLADHFVSGQWVDVSAISIGKGFSGAMKRHNFSGLGASHGVSVSHRAHGSIGGCQDPGRVWKGKKMAGQYGNKRVTVQSLRVHGVDVERGLVFVYGAVPGANGGWVELRDAVKRPLPDAAPFPASVRSADVGDVGAVS